jgi:protein O-mannosyl-transferase
MRKRKNPTPNKNITTLNNTALTSYFLYIKNLSELRTVILANIPLFIGIFVMVFILYANTINGGFVTADDIPGIVNNPLVKDLPKSLSTLELEKIYPAVLFSLFGMVPEPYHLLSIFWHGLNVCMTFVFVYMLCGKKTALWTTMLVAVHPINTEAISWISAYSYILLAILNLLMFISFIFYRSTSDKRLLYVSLGVWLFILVFYRKPWSLLTPVMLFIVDQFLLNYKPELKKMWVHIWFWVPAAVYMAIWLRTLILSRVGYLETLYYVNVKDQTPYFQRVLYTIFMTAKLFIFPKDLTVYHEGESVGSFAGFYMVAGLVSLVVITITIVTYLKSLKNTNENSRILRLIALGITLIYTSTAFSFSPRVLVWSMAERYQYFGSIFFCLIVALIIQKFPKKYAAYILSGILLLYTAKTFHRTFAWKNSKSLWLATQVVSPYSYRVYNNLGDVYATELNYPEAIKNFQVSLQLKPDFADAVHNLGYAYIQTGDLNTAEQYLLKSVEMNSILYQSFYKLGFIEYKRGNFAKATEYFAQSLKINPTYEPSLQAINALKNLPASTAPTK